jgi:hypothetical protein
VACSHYSFLRSFAVWFLASELVVLVMKGNYVASLLCASCLVFLHLLLRVGGACHSWVKKLQRGPPTLRRNAAGTAGGGVGAGAAGVGAGAAGADSAGVVI